MCAYVCHAYQLLPGGPCPEYAYRYRFLGQCIPQSFDDKGIGTAFWTLMAKCRSFSEDRDDSDMLAGWLGSTRALWDKNRFTGWDPRTGLAFRFEKADDSPAPGQTWHWVLFKPAVRRR